MAPVDLERCLQAARRAELRCGPTVVVAVDGPSGSGKTTLAADLGARLGHPPVVHMDDLYPGWDGLAAALQHLHDWVLAPLARGESAAYRRFDWHAGRYAEWHPVPAAPLVLVEGAGSSVGPGARSAAVRIWVEAAEQDRFARGMARDGGTYQPHWQRWARQEQLLFDRDRTRERADVVIDTSAPTETDG